MSGCWLNIAFGEYHLQIGGKPYFRFHKNSFWEQQGAKPLKWFRVYQIGSWHDC